MSYMFNYCYNLKKIIGIEDFDTIKVTKMTAMFQECNELEELNLFYFNTSKVEDMSYMFYNCYNLREIKGISYFDINEDTDISYLFDGCEQLDYLDLSIYPLSNDSSNNKELETKLNEKINKDSDMNNKMDLEKKKSFVIFISRYYQINLLVVYEDFDIFSKLEEELYLYYPGLKKVNITFFANGEEINRTATMKENNIINSNFIFIK